MACTNLQCAIVPDKGGSPIFCRLSDVPKGHFIHPVYGGCRVVYIPCGNCLACRRERRMDLTILQCLEASLYVDNWFITLTYDDEKTWQLLEDVPYSLSRSHLSAFNESMRKHCRYCGVDYRFFACGEYGDRYGRPHYHLSVFGVPPSVLGIGCDYDRERILKEGLNYGKFQALPSNMRDENGNPYWQSPIITARWQYGNHKIYRANKETFQYVAGYVTKKLSGRLGRDFEETGRILPFSAQSRPSIGRPWFNRFCSEVSKIDNAGQKLINDSLSIAGCSWRVPRIFDKWIMSLDQFDAPFVLERIKHFRSKGQLEMPDREDETRRRIYDQYSADHFKTNNKHKEIQ